VAAPCFPADRSCHSCPPSLMITQVPPRGRSACREPSSPGARVFADHATKGTPQPRRQGYSARRGDRRAQKPHPVEALQRPPQRLLLGLELGEAVGDFETAAEDHRFGRRLGAQRSRRSNRQPRRRSASARSTAADSRGDRAGSGGRPRATTWLRLDYVINLYHKFGSTVGLNL
jgi:hypothetical protein